MHTHDVVAIAVGVAASGFDLHQRRIPNAITFGAALLAILASALTLGLPGLTASAGGWALGIALWLPVYALRGIGAADVKLLAAIGAWLGPADLFMVALYAGIAGAVLAIIVVLLRGTARETFFRMGVLFATWLGNGLRPVTGFTLTTSGGPHLPYAVPVLAGTVLAIWLR